MLDNSDKSVGMPEKVLSLAQKRQWRARRRAIFAQARNRLVAARRQARTHAESMDAMHLDNLWRGYDPELLYVECGRCGAPVIWEEGRATDLLGQAGIDPLELDSSCVLVTDGCPACGSRQEYSVRIYRISAGGVFGLSPTHGNA